MWVSERETVFTVRRWQNGELSELILWFSNAGASNTDWIVWDFDSPHRRPYRLTTGLSCRCRMLLWWVIVAICSCCSVEQSRVSFSLWLYAPLSLSTVRLWQTVWGQFCFLSCSGCWSVWCPGKAWLYNCLWFAATLYSLYRAWERPTGRYMLMWHACNVKFVRCCGIVFMSK